MPKEQLARNYEDDCVYGYPDIWAARGAARLIRMQKKPDKVSEDAQIPQMIGAVVAQSLIESRKKQK